MAFNKNELILDKVRSLVANDFGGKMLFRLTSLEDPSLNCTAEGEEITNAIGALITTLYRAKKAEFSATNSLMSLDLAAAQYGSKKEIAEGEGFVDYDYEILSVDGATVKLKRTPIVDSIKYVYVVEKGEVSTAYKVGSAATDTEAMVGDDGTITLPTVVTSGKVYVEYQFMNKNAMRIVNKAGDFPSACSIVIYAYFKDKCNENLTYSGKIICPKAKLNPESVELALTSTGKHPFTFTCMQDYCEDDNELFTIIVSE